MDEDDFVIDTNLPFLSHLTYHEWHSFVNGVAAALSDDSMPDVDAQPAYYNAGVILVTLLTDNND